MKLNPKKYCINIAVREHQQQNFVSRFWLLRSGGIGVVNLSKKGKFRAKIFFQMALNKVLKSCKE